MLTEADKLAFSRDGYLLVENVVPDALCAAVRSAICEFLNISETDPDSWPDEQSTGHGIVPVHHAQALWDVRQHPAVHETFAALHDTARLWVTCDRVSFKTRDRTQDRASPENRATPAEPIHWDGHPGQYAARLIQGLVYLTDTTADQGAFCCVPDIFQELDGYLGRHPEHADSRRPRVQPDQIRTVPGPAGSMVLWDRRMPHSSTRNLSDRPRWVQYVAMDPVGGEAQRLDRVREFESRMPPHWAIVQNVPGQQLPEPGGPARLTDLGRKLVGIEPW